MRRPSAHAAPLVQLSCKESFEKVYDLSLGGGGLRARRTSKTSSKKCDLAQSPDNAMAATRQGLKRALEREVGAYA